MSIEVCFSDDAGWVLNKAKSFLCSKPVHHNLVLTLLQDRVAAYKPGRYWVATVCNNVVGVVFQSPLHFRAIVTPMESEVVSAMVDAISEANVPLPGVVGDVTTTAHFAGQWAACRKAAAVPFMGQRLYEVVEVVEPIGIHGYLRKAVSSDRERLIDWVHRFSEAIGDQERDPESVVDSRVAAGQLWLWDDAGAVSMAGCTAPVEGVARVQLVYTPSAHRNNGYASACVAGLSRRIRAEGHRCILYTDLGNPIANGVYRRIGYRAVLEGIQYRFA